MAREKLRILLLAEMCNPTWTSVPLVGYNIARALVEHPELDITLVTQIRNKPVLDHDPISQFADIHYVDTEWIARPFFLLSRLLRGGKDLAWTVDTAMMWPGYVSFEKQILRRFASAFRKGQFDLIHRVTPLSPIFAGPLAGAAPVPMVIGPINGGLPWPKEFPELYRRSREWLTPLRGLFQLLPYYNHMWRRLRGVIIAAEHVRQTIPAWFRGRQFFIPENGVDLDRFRGTIQPSSEKEPVRFITVGRFVPLKAIDMIIEAMADSAILRQHRLAIIGDGPDRSRLEHLAHERGVADNVEFLGWLDQRLVAKEFNRSDVFVFPSLKEFGGAVVMEAMASRLPCIVADYGGPRELVTNETGIRLPLAPRAEMIVRLRSAMEFLAQNPEQRRNMSEQAIQLAQSAYSWSAKADRIVQCYREVLGEVS